MGPLFCDILYVDGSSRTDITMFRGSRCRQRQLNGRVCGGREKCAAAPRPWPLVPSSSSSRSSAGVRLESLRSGLRQSWHIRRLTATWRKGEDSQRTDRAQLSNDISSDLTPNPKQKYSIPYNIDCKESSFSPRHQQLRSFKQEWT